MEDNLVIKEITVENLIEPIGIDSYKPRFAWKLESFESNVFQKAYQIQIFDENKLVIDTGKVESNSSIENIVKGFIPKPLVRYIIKLNVWDNYDHKAYYETYFETGRLNIPFEASWIEPEQEPTP